MELAGVLHMNKGAGDTSYAKNSSVQSKIISIGKGAIERAIEKTLKRNIPDSIGIADLGCSSGPNTLLVVSEILDAVDATCQNIGDGRSPEFRVYLNDLFSNDFNEIFGLLPGFHERIRAGKRAGFGPCLISAVPGSFYGRLFPLNSLHFVHSSSSLHWLSQVPPCLEQNVKPALNKGKIYVSKSSPKRVLEAYLQQFSENFSEFLRSRSKEMIGGGRMVLSFMGRSSSDPTTEESCYHWELLAHALMSMASEGLIEEEKIDSFNAPYYAPCPEELMIEVEKENSFIVESLEAFQVDWDGGASYVDEYNNANYTLEGLARARGLRVSKTIRAVVESMFESHFGTHIMDDLFRRHQDLVTDYLLKSSTKYTNLIVTLIKKD